jgi:O-antigen ligase
VVYTLTHVAGAELRNTAREPFTRRLIRLMVIAIALVSAGPFNPGLFGSGSAQADLTQFDQSPSWQQYAALALWLGVIGCSLLPGALRVPLKTQRMGLATAFLCYVAVSTLWTGDPSGASPKALVLITTAIGAWLLASILTIEELFDILRSSMFALLLISTALLIFMPQIAIANDYFHAGDWQGVFGSKQELGIQAAFFSFLTLMRLLGGWRWTDAAGFVLGLALTVGSGSRGAAVISVIAPLAIVFARRHDQLLRALVAIIPIEIALAFSGFAYLIYTGADQFLIGETSIDFTQRTLIWSYALGHWLSRPWLGYGIGGFWSDPDILWGFARVHQWLVPDYHDGYLSILVEGGIVGMTLFLLLIGRLCSDLRYLLRGRRLGATGETILGFVILLFTIDLTETYFLRSTNFIEITFTFVLISVFSLRSGSVGTPAEDRRRGNFAPMRARHP